MSSGAPHRSSRLRTSASLAARSWLSGRLDVPRISAISSVRRARSICAAACSVGAGSPRSAGQSGMVSIAFPSVQNGVDRVPELGPVLREGGQRGVAGLGEPVVAPRRPRLRLSPGRGNKLVLAESGEQRRDRAFAGDQAGALGQFCVGKPRLWRCGALAVVGDGCLAGCRYPNLSR
jgi:hypothetical protein